MIKDEKITTVYVIELHIFNAGVEVDINNLSSSIISDHLEIYDHEEADIFYNNLRQKAKDLRKASNSARALKYLVIMSKLDVSGIKDLDKGFNNNFNIKDGKLIRHNIYYDFTKNFEFKIETIDENNNVYDTAYYYATIKDYDLNAFGYEEFLKKLTANIEELQEIINRRGYRVIEDLQINDALFTKKLQVKKSSSNKAKKVFKLYFKPSKEEQQLLPKRKKIGFLHLHKEAYNDWLLRANLIDSSGNSTYWH